ncbi:MAG: PqqD family protein [Deltaproteobacteria bacterium]|nr:PqqD family protein [Deltaproteobacteria bacterium]
MNNIRPDLIYAHSNDVVVREIDGALIIVPLTSGVGDMEDDLFSMNETGTKIWKMIDGKKNVTEVVAALSGEYRAEPGEIERDVTGIFEELLKRRMIVEAAAT